MYLIIRSSAFSAAAEMGNLYKLLSSKHDYDMLLPSADVQLPLISSSHTAQSYLHLHRNKTIALLVGMLTRDIHRLLTKDTGSQI